MFTLQIKTGYKIKTLYFSQTIFKELLGQLKFSNSPLPIFTKATPLHCFLKCKLTVFGSLQTYQIFGKFFVF